MASEKDSEKNKENGDKEIVEIDEDAFYGCVDKFYILKGSNLGSLYEHIYKKIALHSQEVGEGHFSCPKTSSYEAVVFLKNETQPIEFITIDFDSCIANVLFSTETKELERALEEIAREKGFKLIVNGVEEMVK